MSKNINVNPDHYKSRGRERQGEDVVPEASRRELRLAEIVAARERARKGKGDRGKGKGKE